MMLVADFSESFVMVKPDGVQKGLTGEIIRRLESAGLVLMSLKMAKLKQGQAESLYQMHRDERFFQELIEFVTGDPVVMMVVGGVEVVERVRGLMGATDPQEAEPGTIRGDFGGAISENIVHGADSPQNAAREISLFFNEGELFRRRSSEDAPS